jgi:hypothetical protein
MKLSKKEIRWKGFIDANQKIIDKTGLPSDYYATKVIWDDFLMHGYIDHHEDNYHFTVNDLKKEEYFLFVKLVEIYIEAGLCDFTVMAIKKES